jgi:hypothetical protein
MSVSYMSVIAVVILALKLQPARSGMDVPLALGDRRIWNLDRHRGFIGSPESRH